MISAELDDAKYALQKIHPDCGYEAWYKIAAALYNEFGDEGGNLFLEWSSGKYHNCDPKSYGGRRSCIRQWNYSKQLSQIGIGTLFYYAKEREGLT